MSGENLRAWSRAQLFAQGEGRPSTEQTILGCLQRIADALERQNTQQDAAFNEQRRRNDRLQERIRRLEKENT